MSSAWEDYLRDALQDWAPVRVRRMFGGAGLFREERMFGLLADDVLYFKCDSQNLAAFEDAGCPPFRYEAKGKPMVMSYRRCPDEALDDPELLREWAQRGWEAALRAPLSAKKKKAG